MDWTFDVAGALFGVAALLVVIRVAVGPTMLDRAIALDVLGAIMVGFIAVYAAITRATEPITILLVVTLLGFVGSVSIARYGSGSDDLADAEDADSSGDTR